MYAEYWKPMYWNSSTESTSGKAPVEKIRLMKLGLVVEIKPPALARGGDLGGGDAAVVAWAGWR